ncbi:MAG: S8 family serine peptidase, partial [Chloroflexota bacterium]
HYRTVFRGFSASLSDAQASGLRRDPQVSAVVADRPLSLVPNLIGKPVGAPSQARPQGKDSVPPGIDRIDGESIIRNFGNVGVAVVDTGIDFTHPALNVKPPSFSAFGTSANDANGHGTHVAGVIAGRIGSGIGVRGVAPGAPLYAVQVLDANGNGSWSTVLAGLDWVAANAGALKIRVVNLSLGGFDFPSEDCGAVGEWVWDPFHYAICTLGQLGVTVVAAAGNSDPVLGNEAWMFLPGGYPEVIAVSAIADYDGRGGGAGSPTCADFGPDDTLAGFSTRGATVALAAPGVCVLSTWPNGGYQQLSGTSAAAPHVAGAAAVYLASHPGASPAAVRSALVSSGRLSGNCAVRGDDPYRPPLVYLGQSDSDCR